MKITSNQGVQRSEGVGRDSSVGGVGGRFLGTKALKDAQAGWARSGTAPVYSNTGAAGRAASVDTSLRT